MVYEREKNVLPGMRIGSLVVATAVAGILGLATTGQAFAADGTFTYTGGDGKTKTSANPPSGDCLNVVGSGPIRNNTNADVTLYKKPDCASDAQITSIGPGDSEQQVPTFQSLRWDDNGGGGDDGGDDGDDEDH